MLFQRLGWCVQDELQGKNVPDKPGQAENKDDLRGVEFQHNPAQAPRVPASVGADCTRLSQGFMKRCTWTLVSFLCLPLNDIRRIFKNKLFRSKWIFSKNQMIGIKKKKKTTKKHSHSRIALFTHLEEKLLLPSLLSASSGRGALPGTLPAGSRGQGGQGDRLWGPSSPGSHPRVHIDQMVLWSGREPRCLLPYLDKVRQWERAFVTPG